jgi:hypothetical protein
MRYQQNTFSKNEFEDGSTLVLFCGLENRKVLSFLPLLLSGLSTVERFLVAVSRTSTTHAVIRATLLSSKESKERQLLCLAIVQYTARTVNNLVCLQPDPSWFSAARTWSWPEGYLREAPA